MHTVVAFLVFLIGLAATLYYWQNLQQSVQADLQAAYNRQVQEVQQGIDARIQLFENFLRGSAGLFAVADSLNQSSWDGYYRLDDIRQDFPDVVHVGVVQGYDAGAPPVRLAAMNQALESGTLAMSGRINAEATSMTEQDVPLFALYLPVYDKNQSVATPTERRQALLGFVYITLDNARFMNAVLNDNQNPFIGLKIVDSEPSAAQPMEIYESVNFADIQQVRGNKTETVTTDFYGHRWLMTFAASPELTSLRDRQLPQQALWRGLVTCVFFAGLVWYLITDRERKYARQKQEEVQTAKDDLLSLASHQLRTPATVVKQYVGMLLQGYGGKLSDQQVDMLNNAYESNERQLDIINQLLYVARLDAGRITLHTKKLDIVHLLESVVHDQRAAIEEREQRLTLKLPNRQLNVEADPHYLRMVFENLLSNAIKYTPEKGSITIEAHRLLNDVSVRFKDSGVGIDPAVQDNIFEKFTRVENELSTDVNGSGVGLYLTKQIVELHSGTISVRSKARKGAAFTVHLPFRQPKT